MGGLPRAGLRRRKNHPCASILGGGGGVSRLAANTPAATSSLPRPRHQLPHVRSARRRQNRMRRRRGTTRRGIVLSSDGWQGTINSKAGRTSECRFPVPAARFLRWRCLAARPDMPLRIGNAARAHRPSDRPRATDYTQRHVRWRLFTWLAMLMLVLALAERTSGPRLWRWWTGRPSQPAPTSLTTSARRAGSQASDALGTSASGNVPATGSAVATGATGSSSGRSFGRAPQGFCSAQCLWRSVRPWRGSCRAQAGAFSEGSRTASLRISPRGPTGCSDRKSVV